MADGSAPGDDAGGADASSGSSSGAGSSSGSGADATPEAAASDSGTPDAPAAADGGPVTWTVVVAPNGSHSFSPAALSVHAGDTVHWVWQASDHTVTSGTGGAADGLFCSPNDTGCPNAPASSLGATYDHAFATTGTYPYFCRMHFESGMVGSVTVQ